MLGRCTTGPSQEKRDSALPVLNHSDRYPPLFVRPHGTRRLAVARGGRERAAPETAVRPLRGAARGQANVANRRARPVGGQKEAGSALPFTPRPAGVAKLSR